MLAKNAYRQRADEARLEAEASTLENVRERCLRAASAWDAMATREEGMAAAREEVARKKELELTAMPVAQAGL